MVDGILVVNLDPPYVGFVESDMRTGGNRKIQDVKSCTLSELRQTLIELGAITPYQQWPLRDCAIRVPGTFSADTLAKVGLGRSRSAKSPVGAARQS